MEEVVAYFELLSLIRLERLRKTMKTLRTAGLRPEI
jgi:hypothetical protein